MKYKECNDHSCRNQRQSQPLQKYRPFTLLAVSQLIFAEFQIIRIFQFDVYLQMLTPLKLYAFIDRSLKFVLKHDYFSTFFTKCTHFFQKKRPFFTICYMKQLRPYIWSSATNYPHELWLLFVPDMQILSDNGPMPEHAELLHGHHVCP